MSILSPNFDDAALPADCNNIPLDIEAFGPSNVSDEILGMLLRVSDLLNEVRRILDNLPEKDLVVFRGGGNEAHWLKSDIKVLFQVKRVQIRLK